MKNRISELLKTDSVLSSMRYALIWVIWMSLILVGASAFHIIFNTISGDEIQWNGVAILVGAISLFISSAVAGKVIQKKQELKNESKS